MIDFKSATHDLAYEVFTVTVRLRSVRKPKTVETFTEIMGGVGIEVQRVLRWDNIGQAFIVAEYKAVGGADEERANGILDFFNRLARDTGCGIEEAYFASVQGQFLARLGDSVTKIA